MRLMVGPAGSGSGNALQFLYEAVRAGNERVRLLAPTATLAQHLAHQLARDGLVFRYGLIQTLSSFAQPWAGDLPQVPDATLALLVEDAVRRVSRPEFVRVAGLRGFCSALARTIQEFASAGCNTQRLKTALPECPLGPAFLAVYQEVERALDARGLALRATRLERAAARIEAEGLGGVDAIWLDGFYALPDPELRLIQALGRHASVTLTMAEDALTDDLRNRLESIGFQSESAGHRRPSPAMILVRAPGVEREVEEIARRILEQSAVRPFREIGIVVRAPEMYVPLLRAALERFGIPVRFYFDEPLDQQPVTRFFTAAVNAMRGGWDFAATLAAVRLAPRFANSGGMDRFDFAVRERIPGSGIGGLKELAMEVRAEKLIPLLEELSALEEWRSFSLAPTDWAARCVTLRRLYRPAVEPAPGLPGHELALEWRRQAAALDLFEEALEEAAAALEPRQMPLDPFWRAVESVLRLKVLRLPDRRRNVVHVLSAHEARQWVLPVLFVCGMVEKQFPQFHRQDPFFPEAARARLNRAGIRVRTAAEFEGEERALFDSALNRATMLVTLSHPEFDQRGERTLASLYLDGLPVTCETSRAVRPQPRWDASPPRAAAIRALALLDALRDRTAKLSPTSLEAYLQCPFQFFGRQTLHLRPAPPRPECRLDFMTQGEIVHEVLKLWYPEPRDMAEVFESVFADIAERKNIPRSYQTERLRNAMLDDLVRFAADGQWSRAIYTSEAEQPFTFVLEDGLEISGKIDRLDKDGAGRAYVIDYKYSRPENAEKRTEDESLLQAPLYVMAAERHFGVQPAGMFYVGLKGEVRYAGWSDSGLLESKFLAADWIPRAREATLEAVAGIRGGRIQASPADAAKCRRCDYRDVCRIEMSRAALAEGA
jgi:ATP-dependent helicase/DNAse subunit B